MTDEIARRRLLAALAVGTTTAVAGCSLRDDTDSGDDAATIEPENTDEATESDGGERGALIDEAMALSEELAACRRELDERRGTVIEAASLDERPFFGDEVHEAVGDAVEPRRRSVVRVIIDHDYLPEPSGGGTGWVYENGLVVTNRHVVGSRKTIEAIETIDGERRPAETIGVSGNADVALVSAETDGLDPVPIGDTTTLEPGDPLAGVGHPMPTGVWVTTLRAYRSDTDRETEMISEGPVAAGMSGAPIFDENGQVVGLHRAGGGIRFLDTPRYDIGPDSFVYGDSPSRILGALESYPGRRYAVDIPIEPVVEAVSRIRPSEGD